MFLVGPLIPLALPVMARKRIADFGRSCDGRHGASPSDCLGLLIAACFYLERGESIPQRRLYQDKGLSLSTFNIYGCKHRLINM